MIFIGSKKKEKGIEMKAKREARQQVKESSRRKMKKVRSCEAEDAMTEVMGRM